MLNDPHTNRHTDEAVVKQRNGMGGGGGWRGSGVGVGKKHPNFPKMVDDAATKGCHVCYYFGM